MLASSTLKPKNANYTHHHQSINQYDHHHHHLHLLLLLFFFFFFYKSTAANIRIPLYPTPSSTSTSMAAAAAQIQDPSPSSSTRPTIPPPPPRRVPPPCWTHEETSALIDAYHDKWYSLRRGNLKASHWQEVADSVTLRCNLITPSKTSVQCRHKIEKLRKRYRNEKQRSLTIPLSKQRFSSCSSWVYFKKMDLMEKGPAVPSSSVAAAAAAAVSDDDDEDEGEEEEVEEEEEEEEEVEVEMEAAAAEEEEENGNDDYNATGFGFGGGYNGDLRRRPMSNGGGGGGGGNGGGFRLRIPSGQRSIPNVAGFGKPKNYGNRFDEIPKFNPSFNNPNPSSGFFNGGSWSKSGTGRSNGGGSSGNRGEKREMDPVAEMVTSIRLLGEGFVKMETMKLEMARDMEHMRMEMEMKRTEMILESQQRIVDAFTKGFVSNKKVRRTPTTPDS